MLDRTALLSYLKSICDLEKNIPLAEETKKELINKSAELGHSTVVKEEPERKVVQKNYVSKPYKPTKYDKPERPKAYGRFRFIGRMLLLVVGMSLFGYIVFSFFYSIYYFFKYGSGMGPGDLTSNCVDSCQGTGGKFALIIGIISFVICIIVGIKEDREENPHHARDLLDYYAEKRDFRKSRAQYRKDKRTYPTRVAEAEAQYKKDLETEAARFKKAQEDAEAKYVKDLEIESTRIKSEFAVKDYYMEEVSKLDKSIESMNADLEALYNSTIDGEYILYPRYRGRIAVAQLYDYIASGQCPNLGGMDGAYAQYVQDERTARICTQIGDLENVVKNGIKEIINNQYTICNQIDSMGLILRDVRNDLYNMSVQLDEHAMMFEKVASDIQEMKNDSTLTQLSKDINGACESANKVLTEIHNNTKYLDPNSSDKHSVDKILTEIRDNTSVLNPDND